MKKFKNVPEYIASLPPDTRATLNAVRRTIRAMVPDAEEVISYGLPTFRLGRMLVAYGGFAHHWSFFPLSAAVVEQFKKQLSGYETSKGTIRFPINEPIPASLIRRIVRARIVQNKERDRVKPRHKRA